MATNSPSTQVLPHWILGPDVKLASSIRRTLQSAVVYAVNAIVQLLGSYLGLLSLKTAALEASYSALGLAIFYALMRSGYSRRFKDAGMTMAQILFGLSTVAIFYAVAAAGRGTALQLMCLVLVYGMYGLSPRHILMSGMVAVAMLSLVSFVSWHTNPAGINLVQEGLNLALAAILLPMMAWIGQQVRQMRLKQAQQSAELARAVQRVEEMAMRDVLTGLINRRCMTEMLEAEIKRFERGGPPFCVAMLDIDFFKRVNDTFGHQAGDAVLMGLAAVANKTLNKTSVLARWGGEEFLLLLPEGGIDAAHIELQRLALELAQHDWAEVLPAGKVVTVSVGLAQIEKMQTFSELIHRVDKALYEAKEAGRDRICVASHNVALATAQTPGAT